MFVRHPVERVLSAYRDKFTTTMSGGQRFQKLYGRDIIKRFRKNPSMPSLKKGNDVKFDEFVQYDKN